MAGPRFVMLPAAQVVAVRAAVERYRAAQAKLQAQGETGRAALITALAAGRGWAAVSTRGTVTVVHPTGVHRPAARGSDTVLGFLDGAQAAARGPARRRGLGTCAR